MQNLYYEIQNYMNARFSLENTAMQLENEKEKFKCVKSVVYAWSWNLKSFCCYNRKSSNKHPGVYFTNTYFSVGAY